MTSKTEPKPRKKTKEDTLKVAKQRAQDLVAEIASKKWQAIADPEQDPSSEADPTVVLPEDGPGPGELATLAGAGALDSLLASSYFDNNEYLIGELELQAGFTEKLDSRRNRWRSRAESLRSTLDYERKRHNKLSNILLNLILDGSLNVVAND